MTGNRGTAEAAFTNPALVFETPQDVVTDRRFTLAQKREILRRWKYDQLELQVAEEENMAGDSAAGRVLDAILKALRDLHGEGVRGGESPPTKHGSL